MEFTEKIIHELAMGAYNDGKATFSVQSADCALIVVDMQNEFVKPGWTPFWIPGATQMIPKLKGMIECCRGNSIPVIYTAFKDTHSFLDRPASGKFMPNRYKKFDSSRWFKYGKICRDIEPAENEITIYKPSYGAFYDTPLETILRNLGKDTILICGVLTNYCCGMTARQGYERGFKAVVIEDLNATDDEYMHEAEIKMLRKGFAKILNSDQVFEILHKEVSVNKRQNHNDE